MADNQLYIIPTIEKREMTYLNKMVLEDDHHHHDVTILKVTLMTLSMFSCSLSTHLCFYTCDVSIHVMLLYM